MELRVARFGLWIEIRLLLLWPSSGNVTDRLNVGLLNDAWMRILLENITVSQLVNTLTEIHETSMFINPRRMTSTSVAF
jgi:hypothetical protein